MNFFAVDGPPRVVEFLVDPIWGSVDGGGGMLSSSSSRPGAEASLFCFSCSRRSTAWVVSFSSLVLLPGSTIFFCCLHTYSKPITVCIVGVMPYTTERDVLCVSY